MEHLIVFAKAPRRGKVKTRLAAVIGEEAALRACQDLLALTLRRLRTIGTSAELRYTPADAAAEMQPWAPPSWGLADQGEGGLGERLSRAFETHRKQGATRVVVVGSDCPDILKEDVLSAFSALRAHDLCVGPALDGGYWLIGLSKPAGRLFEGIRWSSSFTLRDTLAAAAKENFSVSLLRTLSDVDEAADWKLFRK